MDHQKTRIHPFTCYFCNKLIDNDTEYGHASNCGSVLEPCINKCGSYIPRNMKARHLKECKNKMSKSTSKLPHKDDNYTFQNFTDKHTASTFPKGTKLQAMPSLTVPHNPDLARLNNKVTYLEQFCKQLSQNILFLKDNYKESLKTEQNTKLQTGLQFEKLKYQNDIISEWKRNFEMQTENLKQELKTLQKYQNDTETKISSFQKVQEITLKIEENLNKLQNQFHEHQIYNREALNDIKEKFKELKDDITQENAMIGALWNDYKIDIDNIRQQIIKINETLNKNNNKNSSMVFDLKAVSQISAETSDKLEIQEKNLNQIKNELVQLKLDMENLVESSLDNSLIYALSSPGHLLWRISNFSQKMEKAKENDTVIKSAIFYTHKFGYKIRVNIHLNGIKKWKGRYMIACLHVLKGEYDLLLKWPCYIEGTLTLRDVYNQSNQTTDFSKYICAKRFLGDEENEEPQESSAQYIFVPHTTLFKQNFIKDDTMLIEIKINSINKTSNETTL